MQNHKTYLEKTIKSIGNVDTLTSDLVNFYLSIYDYQVDFYKKFDDASFSPDFLNTVELPIINVESLSLPDSILSILIKGLDLLLSKISDFNKGMNFDTMSSALSENNNLLVEYAKSLLLKDNEKLDNHARENKMGSEEFIFILVNSLKPLFVYLMEQYRDRIKEEVWYLSDCPFCGYYPDMSMLIDAEEGKRYLHCSLCEMVWKYNRISCTVCGNEDMEKLGYFVTEEKDTPYRIDYCDNCKGYIKTIRIPKLREASEFDLTVENIITANLDNSAIHYGYSRP
jgi:formate dehydrogenase maturation protein FdhE